MHSSCYTLQPFFSFTTEHEHLKDFTYPHPSCSTHPRPTFPQRQGRGLVTKPIASLHPCSPGEDDGFIEEIQSHHLSKKSFFFFQKEKKTQTTNPKTICHTVRCRNSLIGNHFVAHSENAGALVATPQLVKPLRFHSTLNKDLW